MSETRDEAIKRTRAAVYEKAKRDGFEPKRARQIAERAVEQGDQQKRDQGHWK